MAKKKDNVVRYQRIKALTIMAGPHFRCDANKECDVEESVALDLIKGEYAVAVGEPWEVTLEADAEAEAPVENAASKKPAETAALNKSGG